MRKPHLHLTNLDVVTSRCTDTCRDVAYRHAVNHATVAAAYVGPVNDEPARIKFVRGERDASQILLSSVADLTPMVLAGVAYWATGLTWWGFAVTMTIIACNVLRYYVQDRALVEVHPPKTVTEGTTFVATPVSDAARPALRIVED